MSDRYPGCTPYPGSVNAPNFSIEWIEGTGHFQHLEKPEEPTLVLRRFFEET